jgi:hypothetical protein
MTFVANPAFEAELVRSPEMVHALKQIADRKAAKARSIAPVGNPDEDPHPGQFRDSIESDAGIENGKAIGRLLSTDPDFVVKEFGSEDTPAHATLRRAVEGED